MEVIFIAEIINRIGEIKNNNKGTPMKIIAYRKSDDIDIQFLDEYGYVQKNNTYSNFTRGCVKNPYDKTIYNIGYIGDGKYMAQIGKKMTDSYLCWHRMIERCYNEKDKDRYPAYYGICTVAKEWFNYQVFAEWYEENAYKCTGRLHLDKDIIIPGNKVYSPNTCLLVPQRINMLFMNKPNDRGLPNGIIKRNDQYYAKYNNTKLGCYEVLEDACTAYASEKEKVIKSVANEFKNEIPSKVYNALIKYKVDVTTDINYIAA